MINGTMNLSLVIDPEVGKLNDPTKFSFKYEYDQFNQKTKETDALGHSKVYKYYLDGNLQNVTDPLQNSTEYTYDKNGNMLSMKDGRGKITSYQYGAFGILLSNTDAETKAIGYKYDLALNKAQMIDRNGNETLFTYDSRNLLLSRGVTQTGDSVSYSYNEVGNISNMTDASGASAYSYDTAERLSGISKNGVPQIGYTYDEVGNISTVTDKKGFVTTYTYDKSNRMILVSYTVAGKRKTTKYGYDLNGNRQCILYEGEVMEQYDYDKNNRLTKLINIRPDMSTISCYIYTYDLAGNQTSKQDSRDSTTNYKYDADGRVLQVEMPGKTTVYDYDAVGNRWSLNETYTSEQSSGYQKNQSEVKYNVKSSEYVYSDSNMLQMVVEHMKDLNGNEVLKKTMNYWYDYNGNQISQTSEFETDANSDAKEELDLAVNDNTNASFSDDNIETGEYSYDGFNRLVKVDTTKGSARTITEFLYDGSDLRVRKTVKKSASGYTPEVTNYQYDRQNVILETDASDNVKTRYVRGNTYIARIGSDGTHSYFLFNGHGDVVQTVSETGYVEDNFDYDIFGNPILTYDRWYSCAIRYAGEFYDTETGLYYLRARYYDSYVGRFISEDAYAGNPNDPLSLNLYTYCHNNPIAYTDPTGHYIKGDEYFSAKVQTTLAYYGQK
ncbi:MAG TPA: RHS repeat-associated core domain-containing protein, partial [Mobilitalea sp.]|nr:RHS repeat-associated core domain-containing protein [Mobilitalea sp.]